MPALLCSPSPAPKGGFSSCTPFPEAAGRFLLPSCYPARPGEPEAFTRAVPAEYLCVLGPRREGKYCKRGKGKALFLAVHLLGSCRAHAPPALGGVLPSARGSGFQCSQLLGLLSTEPVLPCWVLGLFLAPRSPPAPLSCPIYLDPALLQPAGSVTPWPWESGSSFLIRAATPAAVKDVVRWQRFIAQKPPHCLRSCHAPRVPLVWHSLPVLIPCYPAHLPHP